MPIMPFLGLSNPLATSIGRHIGTISDVAGPSLTPAEFIQQKDKDTTPAKPGDNKSNTQTTISENKYIPYNSNLRNDGPAQDGTGCWMA